VTERAAAVIVSILLRSSRNSRQVTRNYTWDTYGRLATVNATKTVGGTVYQNNTYSWDTAGMLTGVADTTTSQHDPGSWRRGNRCR
jgi:YD repeat-containing protein